MDLHFVENIGINRKIWKFVREIKEIVKLNETYEYYLLREKYGEKYGFIEIKLSVT